MKLPFSFHIVSSLSVLGCLHIFSSQLSLLLNCFRNFRLWSVAPFSHICFAHTGPFSLLKIWCLAFLSSRLSVHIFSSQLSLLLNCFRNFRLWSVAPFSHICFAHMGPFSLLKIWCLAFLSSRLSVHIFNNDVENFA